MFTIKADVHSHHRSVVKARAQEVYTKLSQPLQRAWDLNSEKGSSSSLVPRPLFSVFICGGIKTEKVVWERDYSSWLTFLPFHDQGFHVTKRKFWDAIHL